MIYGAFGRQYGPALPDPFWLEPDTLSGGTHTSMYNIHPLSSYLSRPSYAPLSLSLSLFFFFFFLT
ncbi:hypothetical protein ACKS23_11731 [Histoplasma ohiense]